MIVAVEPSDLTQCSRTFSPFLFDLWPLSQRGAANRIVWICIQRNAAACGVGAELHGEKSGVLCDQAAPLTAGQWQSHEMEGAWRIDTSHWSQTHKGCLVTQSTNWNQWLIWWQFLTFPPTKIHKGERTAAGGAAGGTLPVTSPCSTKPSAFSADPHFSRCTAKMFNEVTLPGINTEEVLTLWFNGCFCAASIKPYR